MKDKVPDYSHIQIKKLPPGRAFGAGDLTKWAHNRAVGASGMGSSKTKGVVVRCVGCQAETQVMVSVFHKGRKHPLHCRTCGKHGAIIVKRGRR